MTSSHARRRIVKLALAPINADSLQGFGSWSGVEKQEVLDRKRADSSELSEENLEKVKIDVFQRRQNEPVDLSLSDGELIVLGPANDALRCQGFGFINPRSALRAVQGRASSYGAIFGMTFVIDEELKWQQPPNTVW